MAKKITMSFTVTEANKEAIALIAQRDGCSASQVVNKAIEVYVIYDQQTRQLISQLAKEHLLK